MSYQLVSDEAVLNYVGKNTAFQFQHIIDGIVTIKTLYPKKIGNDFYNFEVSFFYEELMELMKYENADYFLAYNGAQVFELWQICISGEKECLYHSKYENKNK